MLSYPDFKEKSIVIVFATEGQYFSIKNDNLIVKDKEDTLILQTTCHRMLALWVVGHGSVSSGLMERSRKFAFPIYWLSYNFRLIGYWNAATEGNFLLRKKQYTYDGLEIAKHIVFNKITNQCNLLKGIRKKSPSCKDAIQMLIQYKEKLNVAEDLNSILGLEGIASKVYFQNWFGSLPWQGRRPRAKHDIVNVLLDIGYTFLFYMVENMLSLYGFDIYQGVYHRNFYKRKSLVCDLQEPFRCIIDRQVKNAYGLGQIREDDFLLEKGQYKLKYTKSKEYTAWLIKSILEHKADIFLFCQQYYRCFIRMEAIERYPIFKL